jgi:hypothetical protein
MKSKLSSTMLIASAFFVALVVACGGSDNGGVELSLEQYFDEVSSIVEDLEEQTATFDQPLEQEFDSEAEQIEAFRDGFTTALPVFQDFVDDLDNLEPPAVAADAHSELVAGLADFIGGLEDLIEQLADVETSAEFTELLLGPDFGFGAGTARLAVACLELQAIADDNDIDADVLDCAG